MSLTNSHIDIWEKGNLEDILSLIRDGYDKNKILCKVCYYGHLEIVKYLVEKYGANVRANSDYAVKWASEAGHLEVVKYLVEKCGADVRAKNDYAVQWASVGGHLEVVKYLVEKCGADARAGDDWAIRWASRYGHLEVVKYLVEECGANSSDVNCCVRLASVSGHLEVVKYLIEKCGAVLTEVNPKYERYLIVYEKGEKKRKYNMAKRIYFWWVQTCYNPTTLCGHRSMYKGYMEYLSMC